MLLWRRVAVPAFLSVLGLIWLAAHALAHEVVSGPAAAGHGAHTPTLETYMAYLPTSLALCVTLAAAIATGLALGKRWTGRSGRSIWLFGVVPVLGFTGDTLFELVAVGLTGRILWLVERLVWALRDATIVARPVELDALAWAPVAGVTARHLAGSSRSRAPPRRIAS